MNRLTDHEVRVVYLPPMTVASIHIVGGENSEERSAELLDRFIADKRLREFYPAARCFGFNNPDGIPGNMPTHGYERWISVPESMEVPVPFVKKFLCGGTYAAYTITMGEWDAGWHLLHRWVEENNMYDFRWNTVEGVCGWLEEHLNYWDWQTGSMQQLDLLLPIKHI